MELKKEEHTHQQELQLKVLELEKQLSKTKEQLQQEAEYNKQLASIIEGEKGEVKSKIITIKSATKIEFVNVDDIICCNADEAYTHVELINGKTITAARPLATFDLMLEGHTFFRVSKSHLINRLHIVTFFKDRNQILLKGEFLIDVARRRRVEFLKLYK